MRNYFLNFIFCLADLFGINRIFRILNSRRVRILMYHGISKEKVPAFYWTQLDKEKFTQQMGYIKKHYQAVGASSILEGSTESNVIITFDDGLANVYTEAWPVLEKLNLRAVCFVLPSLSEKEDILWTDRIFDTLIKSDEPEIDLTEFGLTKIRLNDDLHSRAKEIGTLIAQIKKISHEKRLRLLNYLSQYKSNECYDSFRLMSKRQISALAESGQFEIAPHTNTHPILSTMSKEEQEMEISGSIANLKSWEIDIIPIFAYPNGTVTDFNDDSIKILKRHGIKAALTTVDGMHDKYDDLYRIKRIPIGADTGKWEFRARLSGLFYFLKGASE